jgi:hypothetical protein
VFPPLDGPAPLPFPAPRSPDGTDGSKRPFPDLPRPPGPTSASISKSPSLSTRMGRGPAERFCMPPRPRMPGESFLGPRGAEARWIIFDVRELFVAGFFVGWESDLGSGVGFVDVDQIICQGNGPIRCGKRARQRVPLEYEQ